MQHERDASKKHFVLVGINYAPERSGIGPYTTALAEYLAARGHEVSIITGMPHYPEWRVSPEYRGKATAEERINGVRLLRVASFVPPRQSALQRARYEASFYWAARRSAARLAVPDAVVAIVPTLSAALLARALAGRHRVPYGIIFQDMMGPAAAQSGIRGGQSVASLTRWLEARAARGASAIAIVAERFAPYLLGLGVEPDRLTHVPNWSRVASGTSDRATTRDRLGWSPNEIVVLHAGNMGLKQGLDQVIAAARHAALREPRIRFSLVGDGNQRRRLEALAAGLPNVEFRAFEPEETFPDLLAAADVLLVSERPSASDMSLPSKLTSYFASGRPVVAAIPADGTTAAEVRRAGGLITPAGDARALADAICRVHGDRHFAHEIAESAQAYAALSLNQAAGLQRAEEFVLNLAADPATTRIPGGAR